MLIRRRLWEDFADEQIKKKNNLNWSLHLPTETLWAWKDVVCLSNRATDDVQ